MGKSKAASLLEGFNKLKGITEAEDPENKDKKVDGEEDDKDKNEASEDDKEKDGDDKDKKGDDDKNEDSNAVGELPVDAIKKVQAQAGDDDEKKKEMVEAISKLSESKHPMAKKIMEAIDDVTSSVDLKKVDKDGKEVNEDADAEYLVVFNPEKWAHLGEKYGKKK